MLQDSLRQYGLVMLLTIVATLVPVGMLLLGLLLERLRVRPRKSSDVKYDTYECGVQPIGGPWRQFNFRYYVYAILFVIFDVEVVFLYPWAVRFNKLGLFALIEILVFVGILLVGWAYAWRKRDLEWS